MLFSCEKDDYYGEAVLHFHGFEDEMEIQIYPIELWDSNILGAEPLKTLNLDVDGNVKVSDLLPGNYFWWDTGSRKGVFQIIENEQLSFDYENW